MATPPATDLIRQLCDHPEQAALSAAVHGAARDAARARNEKFLFIARGAPAADEGAGAPAASEAAAEGPSSEGAAANDTAAGAEPELTELTRWLAAPSVTPEQARICGALFALSLAEPDRGPAPQLAQDLVWLATNTGCDALSWLDAALGAEAAPFWQAIAALAEEPSSNGDGVARAEAIVAAAALRASSSPEAQRLADELTRRTTDPIVVGLLSSPPGAPELRGELLPRPYGPLATALLAVTLVLFVLRAGRVIGGIVLGYRRPAQVTLSARGLELGYRIELLGRVLRDRTTLVPVSNLARVTREVRFSRAGMYAGLLALVLGSYLGVGLLIDGIRVAGTSPPLLGLALLLIVAGIVVDFALSTLSDAVRGKCRLVVVPRKGRTYCIGGLEPARADAMLSSVAEQTRRAQAEA